MLDLFWNVVSVGGIFLLCFAAAYGVLVCAGERDFLLDRKADGFHPRKIGVDPNGRVTIPPGGAYDTGVRIIFNTSDAPIFVNVKGQDYETNT